MIKPRRIGHATFETPDLEKMIDYYTRVMGLVLAEREKDRAFLTTQIGLLAIQLNKGDTERCVMLSFEAEPDADFGTMSRELSEHGITSELRNDYDSTDPTVQDYTQVLGSWGPPATGIIGTELNVPLTGRGTTGLLLSQALTTAQQNYYNFAFGKGKCVA